MADQAPDIAGFARLSPLASARTDQELATRSGALPAGVLLPCTSVRRDVEQLGAKLAVFEARSGRPDGSTRIVAVLSSAAGIVSLPGLVGVPLPRLAGLAFDEKALAVELGCGLDDAALAQGEAAMRLHAAALGVLAIRYGDGVVTPRTASTDVIPGPRSGARNP